MKSLILLDGYRISILETLPVFDITTSTTGRSFRMPTLAWLCHQVNLEITSLHWSRKVSLQPGCLLIAPNNNIEKQNYLANIWRQHFTGRSWGTSGTRFAFDARLSFDAQASVALATRSIVEITDHCYRFSTVKGSLSILRILHLKKISLSFSWKHYWCR